MALKMRLVISSSLYERLISKFLYLFSQMLNFQISKVSNAIFYLTFFFFFNQRVLLDFVIFVFNEKKSI
jgi:hypothetical protein